MTVLTVRADAALAERLRRLDTAGRLRLVEDGPAGFVLTTTPDPDADAVLTDPAGVDAVWRNRLEPFAAALTGARPPRHPAVLRSYDPSWADAARRRIARLRRVLGTGFDYQHIGSTSVPGLAAKPIIDLQVRVPELSTMDDALLGLGYRRATGSRPDSPGVHRDIPRGRQTVPPEVWEKRLYVSPDPVEPAILHIRRADSPWSRYPVRFRDLLRADPAMAARYEHLKRDLAGQHADDPDYDDYTRAKTAFFDEIQPQLD